MRVAFCVMQSVRSVMAASMLDNGGVCGSILPTTGVADSQSSSAGGGRVEHTVHSHPHTSFCCPSNNERRHLTFKEYVMEFGKRIVCMNGQAGADLQPFSLPSYPQLL